MSHDIHLISKCHCYTFLASSGNEREQWCRRDRSAWRSLSIIGSIRFRGLPIVERCRVHTNPSQSQSGLSFSPSSVSIGILLLSLSQGGFLQAWRDMCTFWPKFLGYFCRAAVFIQCVLIYQFFHRFSQIGRNRNSRKQWLWVVLLGEQSLNVVECGRKETN